VLMHLVRQYDIDGLHLDRIRYPEISIAGQTPASGASIGYNATSVARFQRRHGIPAGSPPPAPNDAAWSQWRRDQVTALVRRIYLSAIAIRPSLTVSAALIAFGGPVYADQTVSEVLTAVVKVRSQVPMDARTASFLGTEREGSGVVIDANGLVLTVGYLILEAMTAEVVGPDGKPIMATVVGYDYDTGFGLLRATEPLGVTPMKLGRSSGVGEREQVLVASYGGPDSVQAAFIVSRREFAGYWEYLLEDAIFTAPPHPSFGGAALIGRDGQLLGIGSLFVGVTLPGERPFPGNMFIPIDQLKPILADLIAKGRSAEPPRPWLGVFTEEARGHIFVARVVPNGPADQAGLQPGDIIVGVAGETVSGLADFYRKVWSRGSAGVDVPLNVLQGTQMCDLIVRSADRYQYFQLKPSY